MSRVTEVAHLVAKGALFQLISIEVPFRVVRELVESYLQVYRQNPERKAAVLQEVEAR